MCLLPSDEDIAFYYIDIDKTECVNTSIAIW